MNPKGVHTVTVLALLLAFARLASAQNNLSISTPSGDARPISTVLNQLRKSNNLRITYEDPRYVFAADLQDVTERVQRVSGTDNSSTSMERVIVPKGKPFTFVYSIDDFSTPSASSRAIQRMLSEYAAVGGQVFAVTRDAKRLHVVPRQAADKDGKMAPQAAVLDSLISIAPKQRSGATLLAEICEAVSASSGTKVEVGTVPANLLAQYQTSIGVKTQPARQALSELLDGLQTGSTLVWDLYNDPDGFALNID